MDLSFQHLLLAASLPVCLFAVQSCAVMGNTRPIKPFMASFGIAVALSGVGSLAFNKGDGETVSALWFTLLCITPVCIFFGFLAYSARKRLAAKGIPRRVRRGLALAPLLLFSVLPFGPLIVTAILCLALYCFLCAIIGRMPSLRAISLPLLAALNGLAVVLWFDSYWPLPVSLMALGAAIPCCAAIYVTLSVVPKEKRMQARILHHDLRWLSCFTGFLFLLVLMTPSLESYLPRGVLAFGPVFFVTSLICAVTGTTRVVIPGVCASAASFITLLVLTTVESLDSVLFLVCGLLLCPPFFLGILYYLSYIERMSVLKVPFVIRIGMLPVAGFTAFAILLSLF